MSLTPARTGLQGHRSVLSGLELPASQPLYLVEAVRPGGPVLSWSRPKGKQWWACVRVGAGGLGGAAHCGLCGSLTLRPGQNEKHLLKNTHTILPPHPDGQLHGRESWVF